MDWNKINTILDEEPKFRRDQVREAIFHRNITDWDQASNLSKSLRDQLKEASDLDIPAQFFYSKDSKTTKALITLNDGLKIEAVLMHHADRFTVCVSSQVGCPLACVFCATGKLGLKRNLTTEEIAEQVLLFNRQLQETGERVTNVVFMGMGEPFLNYDNVMAAARMLNHPKLFNISARKISISTIGIVDAIDKFSNEKEDFNLAISLHAPEEKLRQRLIPASKKYSLRKLINSIDNYLEDKNRKVMIEYLLLDGVNDSAEHAEELAELLRDKLVMVNVIVYNSTNKFKAPPVERVKLFVNTLIRNKIQVIERYRFGQDIHAACGQLALKNC